MNDCLEADAGADAKSRAHSIVMPRLTPFRVTFASTDISSESTPVTLDIE